MSDRAGVLITGGARRIGAELARQFAKHGYDIALHYHTSGGDALALKVEIEALGVACILFEHDMADIAGLDGFARHVKEAMPHCAVLVNNASVFERAPFMETDEALFDRQFTVNFKAPFFLTQAFARHFREGCVVNMLDTAVSKNRGSHFAYLLSKKALAEFTTMAARALGPNFCVNGVCPGIVLPSNDHDEGYMESLARNVPLMHNARPEEVAATALWLAEQKHITGQLVFVDGGEHVG